jgi:Cellulose binding domain
MSRHRKRPTHRHQAPRQQAVPRHRAPRHQAPDRQGQPKAAQASPTALSAAVRRVAVTPTFAAGLGVVIAAAMAYPVTKAVISYGGVPPAGGNPCRFEGCVGSPDGRGSLATASPGKRLAPHPSDSGASATAAADRPVMHYQMLRQWQSGFIGQITITVSSGSAPAKWQLRLAYHSAHIIGVWGGRWVLSGDHTVLVTPDGGRSTSAKDGHVQVVVVVSGAPGPPSECAFNGQACRIDQSGWGDAVGSRQPMHSRQESPQPGNWQAGTQQPGGQLSR